MRSISTTAGVAALLASAYGLEVTTFTSRHVETAVDFSSPVTIFWQSTKSDPQSFGIELVNTRVNPSIRQRVASGVRTSDRSYTMEPIPDLREGGGFQFILVAEDSDDSDILARSHQFMSLMSDPREGERIATTISTPTVSPSLSAAPPITTTTYEDGTPVAPPNQRVSGDYGNDDESAGIANHRLDGSSRVSIGIAALTYILGLFM